MGRVEGNHKESAAISQVLIEFYHEEHIRADPRLLERILHRDWRLMFFDPQDELVTVTKSHFMNWYYPEGRDRQLAWEIDILLMDITERTASAKVHSANQFSEYIDYFHFVKIKERWLIVNQLTHPQLKG